MYTNNTYGDAFADVYDEWYHDIDVIDDCVEFLLQLAAGGDVLELGVGTGRVAIPLAARGAEFGVLVTGIDSSKAMLKRLESKQSHGALVHAVEGHMVRDMPDGQFGVVLLAYNTLFNLLSAEEQRECLRESESRLAPGGHVVVDCFVPTNELPNVVAPHVLRTTAHGVVTSEATVMDDGQRVDGVLTEVFDDGRRIAHPWSIRYASVAQIDEMALSAGLKCEQRWSSYARDNFTDESSRHISVYGRR
jgi:SAM-dependent methyltransferase